MTNIEMTSLFAKLIICIKNNDIQSVKSLTKIINNSDIKAEDFQDFMRKYVHAEFNDALKTFIDGLTSNLYSKDNKAQFLWDAEFQFVKQSLDEDLINKFITKTLLPENIDKIKSNSSAFLSLCIKVGNYSAIEQLSNL